MPSPSETLSLWYLALNEPLGIYIRTPDAMQLKSILYGARLKAKDPALANMQVRTSPADPTGTVWIINPVPPSHEDF